MIAPILNRFPLTHLRQWRLSRFWTQAELALRSGVSEPTIVRLERGHHAANMTTIRKLAQAFGIAPTELAWGPAPVLDPMLDPERGPGVPETARATSPLRA
jgi:transcriptional regulator with XRE-family HTH domain